MTLQLGKLSRVLAAIACCSLNVAGAQDPEETPLPTFAELEAAGAVIGEIRIDNQDIFDLSDPRENKSLYSLVNWLHATTRPDVIRKQLLFASGERVSVQLIEETERNLRGNNYLYDVLIRPIDVHDGVVDIEVRTRDTWTLVPTANLSRSGGVSRGGIGFRDSNLLGAGMRFSYNRKGSTDTEGGSAARASTEVEFSYPNAFDGHTILGYNAQRFSDGRNDVVQVTRPFYALDTRWAAAISGGRDDRVISSFVNGIAVPMYRRWQGIGQVSGGISEGLVGRWTRRYSLGLSYERDAYSPAADAMPGLIPANRTLVAPFVRYEVIENDFRKVTNRDLIERTEIVPMGFQGSVQFGRSLPQLGSTEYRSLYQSGISRGFDIGQNGTLLATAFLTGEYGDEHSDRQLANVNLKYYLVQSGGSVLFSSLAADRARYSDNSRQLLLGGDNGLRGYPAHYQSGDRRVLFTAEQRFYTDWFPYRLFRVGAAVFYDAGRAWNGPDDNSPVNQRWLNDVGFGIRILSARSSSGTTLHLDFAFPLRREEGIRSYQFSFMSKTGF